MLIVEDTVDTFHRWDQDDPHWIETFWFGAWIPERRTTVYIYQWFRPVLGIYGGGCFVWDASAYLPWDIPVFRYDVNRPITKPIDLRSLSLDNGTSLKSLAEGRRYEIRFDRDDVEVELCFEAREPAEIVDSRGMTAFFNGHIDQEGRYTGRLRLGAEEHPIDCYGIRDRSWGPRVITDDIRLNYCHGQSEDLAFVCYSRPGERGEIPFKGYVSQDGTRRELVGGARRTRFADGLLEAVELELTDSAGDTLRGRGTPLNRMVYESYPGMINWIYLMRWEIGGKVIYGEEQDVWSLALWHRRDRAVRP